MRRPKTMHGLIRSPNGAKALTMFPRVEVVGLMHRAVPRIDQSVVCQSVAGPINVLEWGFDRTGSCSRSRSGKSHLETAFRRGLRKASRMRWPRGMVRVRMMLLLVLALVMIMMIGSTLHLRPVVLSDSIPTHAGMPNEASSRTIDALG